MNEHAKLIVEDIKKLWGNLNINQKFSILVLVLTMIVTGIFFIVKATEPNWTVLYSDLTKHDAAAICESLKKSGYPYKLSEDKTAVLVRNKDREDLKLFVAENDLIKDTSGGFELLDDLQLGSTDFKNKLTKQRIFQGELTRSIEKIHGVTKARVQLADPERSIFSDEDESPSASVVLILDTGVRLKPIQILAIKNLVAYSVPRLTNDRVFITDQYGNVLSEDVSKNSSDMQSYRTNFEKEAGKKIKDTLETIMGKNNVSVQVSTVMDFNQTHSTIESYTPNKDTNTGIIIASQGEKEVYSNPQQLPSNQNTQNTQAQNNNQTQNQQNIQNPQNPQIQQPLNGQIEQNQNTPQSTIEAQTQAQLTQDPNVANAPLNATPNKTVNFDQNAKGNNNDDVRKLSYEKEKQATTYAVTKEIKQVVYAPGSVVRMSVAVAVNKILTEAEKQEIQNLVVAAAGMDLSRGDVVNVSSLKFTGIDNGEDEKEDKLREREFTMEVLTFIFRNIFPVLVVLIISLIAFSNFKSIFQPATIKEEIEEDEEEVSLPQFDPYLVLQQNKTTPEDFFQQDIQYASTIDKKKGEIINTILGDPEEAARILSSYIKE